MNKIYILIHKFEYEKGYFDIKTIGAFFSKKKALTMLEQYKKLEGFKDHLKWFSIKEFEMDVLNEKEIQKLIKTKKIL